MESTQIIKAESKCNALNIKGNCGCNIETFDQGNNNEIKKEDDNMFVSLLKKLPISISNLRLMMWCVIGIVILYFLYNMCYNRSN